MAGSTKKATLKLLIDDNSNRVVYAEAGKDFVDFLFGLLQVPLGSIMENFGRTGRDETGSLGCIYESVAELDSSYLLKGVTKESLMSPTISSSSSTNTPPLLQNFKKNYNYGHSSSYYGSSENVKEEGFVKDTTQYMVMDNLTVKLMSTISSIAVINESGVKNISSLKEKTVTVDFAKALELLKASFVSTTVLTDVFITTPDTEMTSVELQA